MFSTCGAGVCKPPPAPLSASNPEFSHSTPQVAAPQQGLGRTPSGLLAFPEALCRKPGSSLSYKVVRSAKVQVPSYCLSRLGASNFNHDERLSRRKAAEQAKIPETLWARAQAPLPPSCHGPRQVEGWCTSLLMRLCVGRGSGGWKFRVQFGSCSKSQGRESPPVVAVACP